MNKKMTALLLILMLISGAIGAAGQIFLKNGVMSGGGIIKLITNANIIIGLILSAIGAILWIFVLSKVNLSTGYPIAGGLFYIFLVIFSIVFLKEKINFIQAIGLLLTVGGILILASFMG